MTKLSPRPWRSGAGTMSAREVIARTMKSLGAFDPSREADAVLVALHAADYRILGPGELDVETVERACQSVNDPIRWFRALNASKLRKRADLAHFLAGAAPAAIRALASGESR